MKTFHKLSLATLLLPAMSALAHAHPGHLAQGGETHAHWIALGLALIAALGAAALYFVTRRNKARAASRRKSA